MKGLNLAVLEWIKSHLDKNPLVILSPIFADYEKHLSEIQKPSVSNAKVQILGDFKFNSVDSKSGTPFASTKIDSTVKAEQPKSTFSFGAKKPDESNFSFGAKTSDASKSFSFSSNPVSSAASSGLSFESKSSDVKNSSFSFGAKPSMGGITKSSFTFGSDSSANEKKDENVKTGFGFGSSPATSQSSGFSFTSGSKPFTFSSTAPSSNAANSKEEDEENEEPPKVEFVQVEESDSIYSKKCKVFVKNEEKFGDRGVGTLHLKPVEGQKKTQMIVRADTNLGNLLLNFLLYESIPVKRMGKKDVLIVAIPMPTDSKPSQILIRVKTEEDADELLKTLEKQKKPE